MADQHMTELNRYEVEQVQRDKDEALATELVEHHWAVAGLEAAMEALEQCTPLQLEQIRETVAEIAVLANHFRAYNAKPLADKAMELSDQLKRFAIERQARELP